MKKNADEKVKGKVINPFSVCWVDRLNDSFDKIEDILDKASKGIPKLKKARTELRKANALIESVWDALREIQGGERECRQAFDSWRSKRAVQGLLFLDEQLKKNCWPIFEAIVKGQKIPL